MVDYFVPNFDAADVIAHEIGPIQGFGELGGRFDALPYKVRR
jgi:hypothetical protein